MTDRVLLEKAAKAAGMDLDQWNDGTEPYSSGVGLILKSNRIWNPLSDDGDALRLAVNLRITVDLSSAFKLVWASNHARGSSEVCKLNDNPQAATRRAIVRAAAALGEAA